LLDNLELSYSTNGSPLLSGGDGRNNQIFIATWASKQIIQRSIEHVTMFAIEEPEAHLHPHQQRKLSKYLVDIFDEQIFLTSHSPYIASGFKPDKIVRLYAKNKVSDAAQGGCAHNLKVTFNDFGYRLNATTAEVFFTNGVLLVEGVSEKLFYSAFAKQVGIDLDNLNISIISVDGIGFKPYIKVFKALEIPYVMRTDDDIFTKTKKGENFHFCAGISRVMGIYKELISQTPKSDKLLKYWSNNKANNEWPATDEYTKEAAELNDYIRTELDDYNIFLSINNLEEDLADSKLRASLSEFYDVDNREDLLAIMQIILIFR